MVGEDLPQPQLMPKHPRWRQRFLIDKFVYTAVIAIILGALASLYTASSKTPNSLANAIPKEDAVQMLLKKRKPTIVEFSANNCASCKAMKPVLQALAKDPRIEVADMDIIKEREYINRYQIMLMPTQIFYDASGNETSRHMGKLSSDEILARLGIINLPLNTTSNSQT